MAENQENQCFRTSIGGQALIEGILMRGPEKQAIVVRDKDGELVTKVEELKLIKDKHPILGWPLIRGTVNFGSSMVNGVRALMFSAEYFPDEEAEESEPSKFDLWLEKKLGSKKVEQLIVGLAVVMGLAFSIFLFFFLPTFLGSAITYVTDSNVARNLTESILKIIIFVAYLGICSRMKDLRRVFSYHGAEHKTIFCYEAGLPLTVENVRKQPRHHPRCGTSFLFVVIFVSIIVFTIIFGIHPVDNTLLRFLAHLILLPLIVGVSYEFNRYAGRHDNIVTKIMTAPGLWLQNFTTFEPDDSMIEVGIKSMELVMPEKKGKDAW